MKNADRPAMPCRGGMSDDHIKDQLCARIEELEVERDEWKAQAEGESIVAGSYRDERDALVAHVERLRKAALDAIHYLPGGEIKAELRDAYDDTPETSLSRLKAKWQAEALGHVLAEVLTAVEADTVRAHLRNAMRKLRHQAEGGV